MGRLFEGKEKMYFYKENLSSRVSTLLYIYDLGQIAQSPGDLIFSLQSSTGLLWGQIRLMCVKIP